MRGYNLYSGRLVLLGALLMTLLILSGLIGFQYGASIDAQVPARIGQEVFMQEPLLQDDGRDHASPYNWVEESQIKVYEDRVVIQVKDARWARFTGTKSMDPVLDDTTTGIELVPKSPDDIHVGDVVSYYSSSINATVIHRVIATGTDNLGWYAKFKGDNNELEDPGRIRFNQVRRVLIAVIY